MSWRGTLMLLLVAGVVLGFLLFSSRNRTHSGQEPLLDSVPALTESIRIQESGSAFSLIKTNGLWTLRGDLKDRADPRAVHALLEAAADITPLDLLTPRDLKGAVTLSSLQLLTPKRALSMRADKNHTLWFGIEGPAAGQIYARLDSGKEVYLISGKIAAIAFRPAQEFRDPRLTACSLDRLEEVSLTKGTTLQQLLLRKTPRGWNIESPVAALGEDQAVTAWLTPLLSSSVDRWMPEGTAPSSCGMDSPAAVLTLREEGAGTPLTITIGAALPEAPGSRYVRCSDRPGIAVVGGLEPFLAATPQSLRSPHLQPVEYDAIDRIEIINGITLALVRKPGSEDWTLGDGGIISGSSVKAWFDRLQSLSATSFEPATPEHLARRGLDTTSHPALIRLIAHLSENTPEEAAGERILSEIAFGSPVDGSIAIHEGTSTDLLILPESALDPVLKEPADWITPPFGQSSPSAEVKIAPGNQQTKP